MSFSPSQGPPLPQGPPAPQGPSAPQGPWIVQGPPPSAVGQEPGAGQPRSGPTPRVLLLAGLAPLQTLLGVPVLVAAVFGLATLFGAPDLWSQLWPTVGAVLVQIWWVVVVQYLLGVLAYALLGPRRWLAAFSASAVIGLLCTILIVAAQVPTAEVVAIVPVVSGVTAGAMIAGVNELGRRRIRVPLTLWGILRMRRERAESAARRAAQQATAQHRPVPPVAPVSPVPPVPPVSPVPPVPPAPSAPPV